MSESLPSARYMALVLQIGRDMSFERGWKSEAARQLGVHPSFISKISAGKVSRVGSDLIERAIDLMKIERDYFFDPSYDGDLVPRDDGSPIRPPEPPRLPEGAGELPSHLRAQVLDELERRRDARRRVTPWLEAVEFSRQVFRLAAQGEDLPLELVEKMAAALGRVPLFAAYRELHSASPARRRGIAIRLAALIEEAAPEDVLDTLDADGS